MPNLYTLLLQVGYVITVSKAMPLKFGMSDDPHIRFVTPFDSGLSMTNKGENFSELNATVSR